MYLLGWTAGIYSFFYIADSFYFEGLRFVNDHIFDKLWPYPTLLESLLFLLLFMSQGSILIFLPVYLGLLIGKIPIKDENLCYRFDFTAASHNKNEAWQEWYSGVFMLTDDPFGEETYKDNIKNSRWQDLYLGKWIKYGIVTIIIPSSVWLAHNKFYINDAYFYLYGSSLLLIYSYAQIFIKTENKTAAFYFMSTMLLGMALLLWVFFNYVLINIF